MTFFLISSMVLGLLDQWQIFLQLYLIELLELLVSDRIARIAFNMSRVTRVVALDIPKAFDRVWHVILLHKLKS